MVRYNRPKGQDNSEEDKIMATYEIYFNPVLKLYQIWRLDKFGGEVVKVFKAETAAKKWITKKVG